MRIAGRLTALKRGRKSSTGQPHCPARLRARNGFAFFSLAAGLMLLPFHSEVQARDSTVTPSLSAEVPPPVLAPPAAVPPVLPFSAEPGAIPPILSQPPPVAMPLADAINAPKEPMRLETLRARNAALQTKIEAMAGKSGEPTMAAKGLQLAFLITILQGVGIVQHEIKLARMEGRPIDPKQLMEICALATRKVLDSGEIWTAFFVVEGQSTALGWAANRELMKKPIAIFHALLNDAASAPYARALIQSGIFSVVTFVGFELGAQLWKEAMLQVEDPDDYKMAHGFFSLFIGAPFSADKRRVLGMMLHNVVKVLFLNAELRNMLFYNAWRHRIATGDFAVLVTSMVVFGSIGSIIPGAGTCVGLAFGFVGGLVAMGVPQPIKDAITTGFKFERAKYHLILLRPVSRSDLSNLKDFREALVKRRKRRESLSSVFAEQVALLIQRQTALEHELAVAEETLRSKKALGLRQTFRQRVASELKSAAFRSMFPLFSPGSLLPGPPSLEKDIRERKLLIPVYNATRVQVQELWITLYENEERYLNSLAASPDAAAEVQVFARAEAQAIGIARRHLTHTVTMAQLNPNASPLTRDLHGLAMAQLQKYQALSVDELVWIEDRGRVLTLKQSYRENRPIVNEADLMEAMGM